MKCEICGKETQFTVEPSVYVCDECMLKEKIEQARMDGDESVFDEPDERAGD